MTNRLTPEIVRKCYEHFQHDAKSPCSASAMREAIEMAMREMTIKEYSKGDLAPLIKAKAVMGITDKVSDDLVRMLSEPQRHYHTLDHVVSLLDAYAKYLAEEPDAVFCPEMIAAIWFHDIFYDPQRTDNEDRSKDYARQVLNPAHLDVDLVTDMIEDSKKHEGGLPVPDLFCDLDLGILGSSPEKYEWYARAIRREFSFVPVDDYITGRIKVMNHFLDKPRIFKTQYFSYLEHRTRQNLHWERTKLETYPYAFLVEENVV